MATNTFLPSNILPTDQPISQKNNQDTPEDDTTGEDVNPTALSLSSPLSFEELFGKPRIVTVFSALVSVSSSLEREEDGHRFQLTFLYYHYFINSEIVLKNVAGKYI